MILKRQVYPMPDFVLHKLASENLVEKYNERPSYQQNDYIGWITRTKKQETVDKRLNQMLTELRNGDQYMGMKYKTR